MNSISWISWISCVSWLKGQPRAELHLSHRQGIAVRANHTERRWRVETRAWVFVVHQVERVRRLDPDLQPRAAAQPELAEQPKIHVPDARPIEEVPRRVSILAVGRLREGGRVEPSVDGPIVHVPVAD